MRWTHGWYSKPALLPMAGGAYGLGVETLKGKTMKTKFSIGDSAWIAEWTTTESYVTCPHCGGTGHIRVIFHDDTEVSIECQNCPGGYNPPTGRVRVYDRKPQTRFVSITGIEILSDGVKYHSGQSNFYSVFKEEELFATQDEAMAKAISKSAEADAEERANISKKAKDTRTWAWNASYHRKCLKEAQRNIEYHTAKLNVAVIKAKENV